MPDDSKRVQAKAEQRSESQRATLDMLRGKKPAEREIDGVELPGVEGYVSFFFRAIKGPEYDRLQAKHEPTTVQRANGATFNMDTFAPALLARVCVDPDLSESEWRSIWDDPAWGKGELMSLFYAADQLCNKGLDLAPFARG